MVPFPVRAASEPGPPDVPSLEAVLRLWAGDGGTREFEVTGRSMHPILEGVQRLRVRMGPQRIRFGDIVLFYQDRKLIAHRVVGRGSRGFRTRGDGTRGFDRALLAPDEILGVVTDLLGDGTELHLEGPGAGPVRVCLGLLSRTAGALRLSAPGGPRARTLPGRARDALLGNAYRAAIGGLFRRYAALARTAARLEHSRSRRSSRTLLALLRGDHAGGDLAPQEARRIVQRAARLGVGPILWERLQRGEAAEGLPEGLRSELRRFSYAQTLYNTVMLRELGEVLEALERGGVRPVVLKGAALAGRLYRNVGLRTLSDLDLLVRPSDLPVADQALRRRGYAQRVDPRFRSLYRHHHHTAPYAPPRGHPRVELHTGLVSPDHGLHPDLERMRARCRQAAFHRVQAAILCPEDQLLHVCLHLSLSDRFVRGLKDLLDIDGLVRESADLDWDLFLATVEDAGLGRPVLYALGLAGHCLHTPLPRAVMRRLRRHRLPFLEDRLLRWTSRHFVTAPSDGERVFGVATAKQLAGVLLGEHRAGRRWAWVLRRVMGRPGEDRQEAA